MKENCMILPFYLIYCKKMLIFALQYTMQNAWCIIDYKLITIYNNV